MRRTLGSFRYPRFLRSPFAHWLAVAGLALLTAMVVARFAGDAEALAERYGPLRPVVVAAVPLGRGAVVEPGDVDVEVVPESVIPAGTVSSAAAVVGRTVVAPTFPGLPVIEAQLSPDGRSGLAALLPPGSRAIAVPNGRPGLVVELGDEVDVLATFDPAGSGDGTPPTFPVASGALVVGVGDESVTIAVSADDASRVAFALAAAVVTLALTSPAAPGEGAGIT